MMIVKYPKRLIVIILIAIILSMLINGFHRVYYDIYTKGYIAGQQDTNRVLSGESIDKVVCERFGLNIYYKYCNQDNNPPHPKEE